MALGSFDVTLRPDTPQEILDQLVDFGHIIVTKSSRLTDRVDVLSKSIYTGVVTDRDESGRKLTGHGMVWHLADEEDKGEAIDFLEGTYTFANAIRAVLPASVHEGTLHAIPGTKTIKFSNVSKRKAIEYICSLWNAEFEVTPQGYLNAGTAEQLFLEDPQSIVVWKREIAADDPNLKSLPIASSKVAQSRADYTTDVWLLPQGEGPALESVKKTLDPPTAYLDLWGNPIVRTRIISESGTLGGLANERALAFLARFQEPRNKLDLSLAEFDIEGTVRVGDWTYVYDRSAQLYDEGIQKRFQGKYVNPTKIRIVGAGRPIRKSNGVFYRRHDGSLLKLTEYVVPEAGDTTLEVGAFARSLTSSPAEPVGPRVNAGDSSIPAAPVITEVLTGTYRDREGRTLALLQPEWDEPLNTDGSTIVDGRMYEIGYRLVTELEWQFTATLWDTRKALIQGLATGGEYDLRVRAEDLAGNVGEWSAIWTVIAAPDTFAPSPPAAPTVAGEPLSIQVSSSLGKASGGTFNLEPDIVALCVYGGTTPGFAPSAANKLGEIPATQAQLIAGTPVSGIFQMLDTTPRLIKITAVDASGNESDPSVEVGVTAELWAGVHIGTATITNAHINDLSVAKLTSGEMTTALFTLAAGGLMRAGRSAPPYNYWYADEQGWRAYRNGTSRFVGGTAAFEYDLATGALNLFGASITAGVFKTAPSGQRVELTETDRDALFFYTGDTAETFPGWVVSSPSGSGSTRTLGLAVVSPGFGAINSDNVGRLLVQSANPSGSVEAIAGLLVSRSAAGGNSEFMVRNTSIRSFSRLYDLRTIGGGLLFMTTSETQVWGPGSGNGLLNMGTNGMATLESSNDARLRSSGGNSMLFAGIGNTNSTNYSNSTFINHNAANIASDERFKQHIIDIDPEDCLSRVLGWKLVEFEYKPEFDPEAGLPGEGRRRISVIAQSLGTECRRPGILKDEAGDPWVAWLLDTMGITGTIVGAVKALTDKVNEMDKVLEGITGEKRKRLKGALKALEPVEPPLARMITDTRRRIVPEPPLAQKERGEIDGRTGKAIPVDIEA